MRIALAHAVQVELRLDGQAPALELACGLPVEGFAATIGAGLGAFGAGVWRGGSGTLALLRGRGGAAGSGG